MFPTIASREYSHILVGRQPHRMVRALEHIFDLSLQNPLVTYLAGDPGSGKSHTVLNLERRSLAGQHRHVVVINANLFNASLGNPLDQRSILAAVHQDTVLREMATSMGIESTAADSNPTEAKMIEEINGVIAGINEPGRRQTLKPFGLVIAVDGLDEYVRPSRDDTETFILNVRFLLDSLERTCILLSLTSSVFEETYRFVSRDRTFLRRFIPPQEYDGTRLDFKSFTDTEALNLYEEYRNFWLQRAEGLDDHTLMAMRGTSWPISHDAVLLAREATAGRPGPLQHVLQSAFERLQNRFPEAWCLPNSVVDLSLMADVIALSARRSESGVDVSREDLGRRLALLTSWKEKILTMPRTIPETEFVGALQVLLADSGFDVESGGPISKLSIGQIHILGTTKNGKAGKLGVLLAVDNLPNDEDIRTLNLLVATGSVHQLVVFTERPDFDWIYSPREHPIEFEKANQRHLGNFTYVMKLRSEHVAGIALAGKNLFTPDRDATLRIADRSCSPIPGFRLSDLLASMARSAILVGNPE